MGWTKLPCLAFSIKDEHRMYCFNSSLHPQVLYKKPHASLDAHETYYWVRGSHSPTKAGRFYQRDIDFSVLIILTNLWKLLRQPEGPFYTTTNSTAWSTLATHLPSLCLGVLFSPSDLWYSSSSLSHRPSTSLLYVLQLSLSRTTPYRYSVGD